MARRTSNDDGYESYGFGTEYLTPDQRIREEQLAPERLMEASISAHRAANPLVETPVLAQAASVAPSVPVPPSNPLVRPPVPISTMGADQQIKWQQLQDTQRANQMALETGSLDADIKRQNLELRAEQIRQNRELAAHTPRLREALNRSTDEYLELKAELTDRFPIGMGSPESDRIFGEYEKIHAKKEGVEAELNKARTARQEGARLKREDAAVKIATQYGGDVVRDVTTRIAADPVKGIDDAYEILAQVEQKSIVQSLKDANPNLTDQEIAQKYGTGKDFNYQAARNAPKSALSLLRERKQARADFAAIDKARVESRFDPEGAKRRGKDPYANTTWTPERQQEWDDAAALLAEVTPKIGDNRAGVQGMMGAREGESLYKSYARPAVPATVAAKPSPTPAPPPLNPAYPEQWRGGKRYVQVNGQWYLSKVQ